MNEKSNVLPVELSDSQKNNILSIPPANDPIFVEDKLFKFRVAISREVARSYWNANLRQKRLLTLAISRIDYSKKAPNLVKWNGESLDFGTVIVTVSDYAKYTNQARQNDSLRDLRSVGETLTKTSVSLFSEDDLSDNEIWLVDDFYYHKLDGAIEIKFTEKFLKHLHSFPKNGYIPFTLKETKNLSLRAIRLLELIRTYSPTNISIPIDKLQHKYNAYSMEPAYLLRKHVRPAIEELKKNFGRNIEIKLSKRRGKISMIKLVYCK